jgi:hypothetical protein
MKKAAEGEIEELIDKILVAGFHYDPKAGFLGSNPFFYLYGRDKKPWQPPHDMTPADVLQYIRHRYGDRWAQWSVDYSQLTVH